MPARCAACPLYGCRPPAEGCAYDWHAVHAAERLEPIAWVPEYRPTPTGRTTW